MDRHVVKRTRNWCLTVKETETNLDLLSDTGNPDFVEFEHNNKKWEIFIGPVEGPDDSCMTNHRHVGIKCSNWPVTKTAAQEAIEAYCNLVKGCLKESYCQPLDTTWSNYIAYARKTVRSSRYDNQVKEAAEELREEGQEVGKKSLKRKLVAKHTADYYNKRLKMVVDTFLDTEFEERPRGFPRTKLNREFNAQQFEFTFTTFQQLVAQCLVRNAYACFWREKEYASKFEKQDLQLLVEFLALAPSALFRRTDTADNLPALFLCGERSTGKSTFFISNDYLKKVPTDAQGVSRFKMMNKQRGLLMDDIHPTFFINDTNSSTLKQAALGYIPTIKTSGDTETICAWLVCTSNHPPVFMEDRPPEGTNEQVAKRWEAECGAWKRRFIVLNFADYIDGDPVCVNWNDTQIGDRAADYLNVVLNKLKERQPELYKNFLEIYHETIQEDYADSCDEPKLIYNMVDFEKVDADLQLLDLKQGAPTLMVTAPPTAYGTMQGQAPEITNTNIDPQELEWTCSHEPPVPHNKWCMLCEQDWKRECSGLVPPSFLKVCCNHERRACPDCFKGSTATSVIDYVNFMKYQ